MKCNVIDTLLGVLISEENGHIINFLNFNDNDQKIAEFFSNLEDDIISQEYSTALTDLKNSGFDEFVFDNKNLEKLTSQKLGYKTLIVSNIAEFKSFRVNIRDKLKTLGVDKTDTQILEKYKKVNEERIKKGVSKAGERYDTTIIQLIETLEIIKKSINLFSDRLREWYGLHFPELTDKIVEDNILLSKLVSKLGNRNNYTLENLKNQFNFNDSRIQLLIDKASSSMGAEIDLKIVQDYANQILALDATVQSFEDYLEVLMERVAPNLKAIIGSLIGAKLIAKAGGLKKLAFMPASRVQIIGAEKALYRYLKSGEKMPKHGIIFQWKQIRSSPPWIRGKISRLISGKIGILTKVDMFGGEFIGETIAKEIEDKIKELVAKYPKPPKAKPEEKKKVEFKKQQGQKAYRPPQYKKKKKKQPRDRNYE